MSVPMKGLVVDDSPAIRRRLIERLEGIEGVRVVGEAGDAGEALAVIRSTPLDFMTLDIRMPAVGGLTLLGALQKMEHATRVVVITNNATPEYRRRCMELGAFAFLDKSNQFEELILIVEKLQRTTAHERNRV